MRRFQQEAWPVLAQLLRRGSAAGSGGAALLLDLSPRAINGGSGSSSSATGSGVGAQDDDTPTPAAVARVRRVAHGQQQAGHSQRAACSCLRYGATSVVHGSLQ
jgi:hypothetical protein